ncbi:hypothetical protein SynA15127_00731 [Synechococcus sp. A15-127]|nr:hypothetical protein SynA15127_00731 [Synechococcus sp. A15-127]
MKLIRVDLRARELESQRFRSVGITPYLVVDPLDRYQM